MTKTSLYFVPLALLLSAVPALAQDAPAAPTPPAPAVEAAPAAEAAPAPAPAAAAPTETASKPAAPDPAKLITPDVVAAVKKLLAQPVTTISIGASNDAHAKIDQAGIDALDNEWKAEAKAEKQPLIAEMLSSPLSNYLLYLQARSAGLYTEMFVMDDKGLNVGQSSVTSDYWQGDEGKFQKTFQVGPDAVFIDEAEFNDDDKTWRAQVNFTVVDPQSGKPIGAATIEMNLTELERRQAQSL
ncbi:hypothetical protein [Dongia sp. agr-C8]